MRDEKSWQQERHDQSSMSLKRRSTDSAKRSEASQADDGWSCLFDGVRVRTL